MLLFERSLGLPQLTHGVFWQISAGSNTMENLFVLTETSNFCEIQKLFHTERFTGDIITITNYQIIRDIF